MFWRSPFDYISFNSMRSPESPQGSLVAALDKFPLEKRCAELSHLFRELPLKELQHYLPTVVEHVFGLGAQPGWGLRGLAHGRPGFEAVRHFLGPEGPLLRLVYRLASDASLKYDFPVACLPFGVQQSLSTGAVPPPFCAGKLPVFQGTVLRPSSLQISAFELYMFHFAYHVINPSASLTGGAPPGGPQPMLVVDVAVGEGRQQRSTGGWASSSPGPGGGTGGGGEGVHLALVQDYLHYFLPADHEGPPELPGYDQPALFAGGSPAASALHYRDLWGSPAPATPPGGAHRHLKPQSCLIRKDLLASLSAPSSPSSFHPQAGPGSFRSAGSPNVRVSESFLEILLEFWLGRQQQGCSPASPSSLGGVQGAAPLLHHSHSVMAEEWYVPSEYHVLVVRVLVKYLHHFCYSLRLADSSSLYACSMQSPMDDVRRAVPALLRKRLYEFLKQALSCWPLDSSFRLPLETWLSFVQPWRYASPLSRHQHAANADGQPVDERWQGFVQEQLLFYTELLGLLLPRFCRMDLASRRNSFMLHRVAKVFSQPGLFGMIRKAEEGAGASGGGVRPLRQHVADLEEPGFVHRPLCSDQRRAQVAELVRQAAQAWQAVRRVRPRGRPPSWLSVCASRLSALVSRAPPDEAAERRRTLGHLQAAVQDLCALFQLSPVPEMWDATVAALPEADDGDDTTDSAGTADVGGSCVRGPLEYRGNPDTEPIRSYEVVFLVRLLHLLSCALNARYGGQLVQWYERPGFAGHVARQLLRPPTTYTEVVKGWGVGRPAVHRQHALPPRLCLRLLAHRQLLAYVAAVLLVAHSLGYGPGVATFTIVLFAALFVLLRAAWDWARSLSGGRSPPVLRPLAQVPRRMNE